MSVLLEFISDPDWRDWFEKHLKHPWRRPIEMWGVGFAVAVGLVCIGSYILFTGHVSLPAPPRRLRHRLRSINPPRPTPVQWDGNEAIAIGLAILFFGIALHFICFWGNSDRLGLLGRTLGLGAALVSLLSFLSFLALNFVL